MNGYEYTRQLKAKIAESLTHTLDLSDAIAFIKFYGLRNLFNAQGDIRFVGQVAIDVLDKAIFEEIIGLNFTFMRRNRNEIFRSLDWHIF